MGALAKEDRLHLPVPPPPPHNHPRRLTASKDAVLAGRDVPLAACGPRGRSGASSSTARRLRWRISSVGSSEVNCWERVAALKPGRRYWDIGSCVAFLATLSFLETVTANLVDHNRLV